MSVAALRGIRSHVTLAREQDGRQAMLRLYGGSTGEGVPRAVSEFYFCGARDALSKASVIVARAM
jgi:hypothetical protein